MMLRTTTTTTTTETKNLRREQSAPCQFRSQVHISFAPQTPCPEHALGHSAKLRAVLDSAMKVAKALLYFIFNEREMKQRFVFVFSFERK
jgi:hypothetical protein